MDFYTIHLQDRFRCKYRKSRDPSRTIFNFTWNLSAADACLNSFLRFRICAFSFIGDDGSMQSTITTSVVIAKSRKLSWIFRMTNLLDSPVTRTVSEFRDNHWKSNGRNETHLAAVRLYELSQNWRCEMRDHFDQI